ncbi:MAG: uncharacterized protein QOJ72_1539 [Nocardioidaceae bacterium]|nr:uncharacterized protein [Nocardioidaceae bacterium]
MPSAHTDLVIETSAGPGRISLSRPPNATGVLALTHDAGRGVDRQDLFAVRDAAVAAGVAVALITQPYRVANVAAPPPRPSRQDPPWIELIAALRRRRGFGRLPLAVGGRSNGSRVACRTAEATGAAAVIALAFPLSPPGKPDVSRLSELEAPVVPVLVIPGAAHGLTKDVGAAAEAVVSFLRLHQIAR